ncbi:MAG TPA: biotin/lipoyl-binding protein [Lacunisphaera sp.]|nr:biotin/lipoyl-binding protein [Lacunisphaera sp.]
MADDPSMFSESWHRIAGQRVQLRASVDIRRQQFRGEPWYVVHDKFTNSFYRIRPGARRFLVHLGDRRTVEEAWRRCLAEDPEGAPGQSEIIQLLAQLHQASLIQSELPPDSRQLFERVKRHRQAQVRNTLASVLFLRIPLWDPDRFLQRFVPVVRVVFTRWGFLVWLGTVLAGLKVAIDHHDQLFTRGQNVLAPENLVLLYGAFFVTKLLHELGHAFSCRSFRGEVHVLGVMLLVFSPVPYVDVTSAWAFRERWRRIWVGAAGMYVELFLAALATFVWAQTGSGTVNSIAYNVMFVASVSTLVFNLNPLLRFDGYYILSDLMDAPNLHQRSRAQVCRWAEKWLFGLEDPARPAATVREAAFLGVFGLASTVYRIVVFTLIILFIADKFFGIGLIAAVMGGFSLFILPVFQFFRYLAREPRLEKHRVRAVAVSAGILAALLAFLAFCPWPNHTYAPGMLQTRRSERVVAGSDGYIQEFFVESGQPVHAGDPLVRMTSPELDLTIAAAAAKIRQVRAQENLALEEGGARLRVLRRQREAAEAQQANLLQHRDALLVRAGLDGIWVSSDQGSMIGELTARGHQLGQIIQPPEFEFVAVVAQADSARLFAHPNPPAEIRLAGQAGEVVPVDQVSLIPGRQTTLPTAALGWTAGGPVKVQPGDREGLRTAEPFFKAIARLRGSGAAKLLHGQTGYIQFTTGTEPLLVQGWRRFRQLLQQRYQI